MMHKIKKKKKNAPRPWPQAGQDLELMKKFDIEIKRLYHLPSINLFPS